MVGKRWNPRTYMVLVICITTLGIIHQDWQMLSALCGISIFLQLLIHPNLQALVQAYHRFRKMGTLFLSVLLLQAFFHPAGVIWWQKGILSFSSGGLLFGIETCLRFILIVLAAGILFHLDWQEYLQAFRAVKLPYELCFLVANVISFLPMLDRTFQLKQESLRLRGIDLSSLPLRQRWRAGQILLFPILAQVFSQLQYRVIALDLKGFRKYRSQTELFSSRLQWFDWLIQLTCLVLFTFFVIK